MNGEISLRRATTEDIDSIFEIEKSLVRTKLYIGLADNEDAAKEITENTYYLILKDGKIVGDVAYQITDENHAYICELAVAKAFQHQGIARRAVEIILEKLRDVKLISLVTHPENDKAIKLYKSFGFKQVGEPIENYFGDGEPRIKMVLEK
jgi:ribosomal-protein-alanine N-acetyltransferase